MNYISQNQNGDAAQYFTAYKFTTLFKWPFRLYSVDLGIDGEFEILDKMNKSTGSIVKVQIKSVSSQDLKNNFVYVYPTDAHIHYWKTFCTPVVMCAVDVVNEKIYWCQINETNAYKSENNITCIKIEKENNLLTKDSKNILEKLISSESKHNLTEILERIQGEINKVKEENINCTPVGFEAGRKYREVADKIRKCIREAEDLAKYYPWKFSLTVRAELKYAEEMAKHIRMEGDAAITDDCE